MDISDLGAWRESPEIPTGFPLQQTDSSRTSILSAANSSPLDRMIFAETKADVGLAIAPGRGYSRDMAPREAGNENRNETGGRCRFVPAAAHMQNLAFREEKSAMRNRSR